MFSLSGEPEGIMVVGLYVATLIGFVACFASFIWAMTGTTFFTSVDGFRPGARAIQVFGLFFLIAHLVLLLQRTTIDIFSNLVALAVYMIGFWLFWWAIKTNRAKPLSLAFSRDLPEHLVETGPYKYVRHPFYASYMVAWIAGVVATGSPVLIISVLVMSCLYYFAARMEEEKFSHSTLAAQYQAYRKRTGMFLPALFSFVPMPSKGKSEKSIHKI
jgi:protein-S-isoprenylcysteine O-methyltransferase Ste14